MNSHLKYLLAWFLGAIVGIVCTAIISSAMIEICINRNFTFYFGFLYMGIGGLLFWRTYIESKSEDVVVIQRSSDNYFNHKILVYFISLVSILTGVLCIALRQNWYIRLGRNPRMLFLVMFGLSFSFLVVFIIVDLLNCIMRCCSVRPIITGRQQTYLTILGLIMIGAIYSFRLGFLDEEDMDIYKITLLAMRREGLKHFIGIFIGGPIGLFNEIVNRYGEDSSIKVQQDV